MVDLHVISVRLRDCPPLPFYGGSYESLDASDRRSVRLAAHLVPVAYWCGACAAALAMLGSAAEAEPRLRFRLGTP